MAEAARRRAAALQAVQARRDELRELEGFRAQLEVGSGVAVVVAVALLLPLLVLLVVLVLCGLGGSVLSTLACPSSPSILNLAFP